jgi:hypothetical protein
MRAFESAKCSKYKSIRPGEDQRALKAACVKRYCHDYILQKEDKFSSDTNKESAAKTHLNKHGCSDHPAPL